MRLLERDRELDVLAASVAAATRGTGSLVLLAGEAGIGKTSLVRALRARLPAEVAFTSGSCEPLSVPVPLAPLRELAEGAGGGDPAAAATDDRLTLARALHRALAERGPVVAVIEDAHWADPLTIDLLRLLTPRLESTAVVLVVTYRDDELAANPPLALLVGDLATSPVARRLALRRLSRAAVDELAAGTGLDGARLLSATSGNPFLVVEAIAAGGCLPASVRDAALSRAARLSLAARRVVDLAAVVGSRVEPALLRAVLGEGADAVEEALARGVLVADGPVLGFRHELIREALAESISPPRRIELHRRVHAALARDPGAADEARLAHHAELGGLTQEAARHAIRAAAAAEQVGALRETLLQADRALRLGTELDDAERFELLVQYARAANFASPRLEEGAGAAERAVALAEGMGDQTRRGRALMVLAYPLWSLERVTEARAAARQAVRAFSATDDAASLTWALATLIRMEATAFDPAAAIALVPEALELAEASGLEEARVDVMISLGLALGHRGDPEALTVLTDALSAARAGGFTIRIVRSYVNLATVAVILRAHDRVDEIAAEALPFLEERQVSRMPIMGIRVFRARSLLDRGRWDEAREVAARRERWWLGEFATGCELEGLIRSRRGEPGGGDLLAQAWQEITAAVAAESARHAMVRLARVEAAWLDGDRAGARAKLAAAATSPAVLRFARPAGELALWGRRLGVELPLPDGASDPVRLELEGEWRRAVESWHELGAPYEAALAALPGDERAARAAVASLHRLGAHAAVRAFTRDRAARGHGTTRGPRRTTLEHPAGLTRREQEVLEALDTGASNGIIAQSLHLSERTVAHHVSSILTKLGAPNRYAAVEAGRRRGLLPARAR